MIIVYNISRSNYICISFPHCLRSDVLTIPQLYQIDHHKFCTCMNLYFSSFCILMQDTTHYLHIFFCSPCLILSTALILLKSFLISHFAIKVPSVPAHVPLARRAAGPTVYSYSRCYCYDFAVDNPIHIRNLI